jgi:hypothetical protein
VYWAWSTCFYFLWNFCFKHFFSSIYWVTSQVHASTHVRLCVWNVQCHCPVSLKSEYLLQILVEHSNIKFYETLFIGSWVVRCWEGRTDIHGKASFSLATCQRYPVNTVKILFACNKKLRRCYIALLIHVFQVARHTDMAAVDLQD